MPRNLDPLCPTHVWRWRSTSNSRLKEAPGTFDKRHVQDNMFRDIVRSLLTPEFDCAMRRVLEKKIYRIFCFLDEDMDSPGLKTSQSGKPPIHDFKLLRVRCLDTFARFCKCFTVSAGSCKINIDQHRSTCGWLVHVGPPLFSPFVNPASHSTVVGSGYISKSSLIICRDKLFDLALIEKTKLSSDAANWSWGKILDHIIIIIIYECFIHTCIYIYIWDNYIYINR